MLLISLNTSKSSKIFSWMPTVKPQSGFFNDVRNSPKLLNLLQGELVPTPLGNPGTATDMESIVCIDTVDTVYLCISGKRRSLCKKYNTRNAQGCSGKFGLETHERRAPYKEACERAGGGTSSQDFFHIHGTLVGKDRQNCVQNRHWLANTSGPIHRWSHRKGPRERPSLAGACSNGGKPGRQGHRVFRWNGGQISDSTQAPQELYSISRACARHHFPVVTCLWHWPIRDSRTEFGDHSGMDGGQGRSRLACLEAGCQMDIIADLFPKTT